MPRHSLVRGVCLSLPNGAAGRVRLADRVRLVYATRRSAPEPGSCCFRHDFLKGAGDGVSESRDRPVGGLPANELGGDYHAVAGSERSSLRGCWRWLCAWCSLSVSPPSALHRFPPVGVHGVSLGWAGFLRVAVNLACVLDGSADADRLSREELVALVLELRAENKTLRGRIEELERRANRDSGNSSMSPSSDPPKSRAERRRLAREAYKRSMRKSGGQPGHQGKTRELAAPERVDQRFEHLPERCGCGHVFCGGEQRIGDPVVHQQYELPPARPLVFEHARVRLACPGCVPRSLCTGVASRASRRRSPLSERDLDP